MKEDDTSSRDAKGQWGLIEALSLLLFAYITLVPFYYLRPLTLSAKLPSFFLPKYLPFLLVVLIGLVWVGHLHRRDGRPVRLSVETWILFYLGVGLVSLVWAVYPWIGLVKWAYYNATGVLFGYILAQHLRDWTVLQRLVRGVALIAGIGAVYAFVNHLAGRDYLWGEVAQRNNPYYGGVWRATLPFGNSVSTATYLVLCYPFMLWEVYRSKTVLHRSVFAGLAIVSLCTIAFTQSRGGWMATGTTLIVAGLVLGKWGWERWRQEQRWTAVLILLLALPVGGVWLQGAGLHRIFTPEWRYMEHRAGLLLGPRLEQTEHYRIAQYRNVVKLVQQHPFLGIGFGNFTRTFEDTRDAMVVPEKGSPFHTTDNMYLMVAAETGIVGLLVFLVLLGKLLWQVYCGCRSLRGERRGLQLAFLAGGGGFLVNMFTWDPLNDPTLRLTFWMLAGMNLAVAVSAGQTTGRKG